FIVLPKSRASRKLIGFMYSIPEKMAGVNDEVIDHSESRQREDHHFDAPMHGGVTSHVRFNEPGHDKKRNQAEHYFEAAESAAPERFEPGKRPGKKDAVAHRNSCGARYYDRA